MICLYCDSPSTVKKRQLCSTHYMRWRRHGDANTSYYDGRTKDNRYQTWHSMKKRCNDVKDISYHNYGGRGIKVCDRWLGHDGFSNFINDMGEKPHADYSIDRIDHDGNYEPSNCRWVNSITQNSNKRNNNKTVGVYFDKGRNKWASYITIGRIRKLERSDTMEEAIIKRKQYEQKYTILEV